jgi:hypothetical protein
LAPPVVSAQLASAPTPQPHWATSYFPALAFAAASSSTLIASKTPRATTLPITILL